MSTVCFILHYTEKDTPVHWVIVLHLGLEGCLQLRELDIFIVYTLSAYFCYPSLPLAPLCSIRYHCLHPDYIHSRLKELGKQYQLRILLVLVDMVSYIYFDLLIVNTCA